MMYSGIDLHANNSVVAVIDDADCVVAQKRLPGLSCEGRRLPQPVEKRTGRVVVEFDLQLVLVG